MEYTFTLRQETGLLLLGGLVLCLLLVFFAGWLVGVNSQVAQLAADTTAASRPRATVRTGQPTPVGQPATPSARQRAQSGKAGGRSASGGSTPAAQNSASSQKSEPSSAPASTPQPYFAIQIGGFAERTNARDLARQVRRDGRTVDIETERRQGRVLHQVWVGRYETRAAANQRLSAVQSYTGSAFVVRRGGT